MRAGQSSRRAALLAVVITLGSAASTACDTLSQASQIDDRGGLAIDLAGQLERSSDLTYSAEYQLSGGKLATITQSQAPPRSAYTFPGGKIIVRPDDATACTGMAPTVTCRRTPWPSPGAKVPPATYAAAGEHGLLPPVVVIGLLTAAALDPDATIRPYDTTIAGVHASCVEIAGLENPTAWSFRACVTTDGVLGSFAGEVNGTRVDMSLTQYRGRVPADAFDLPRDARIIDGAP